METAKKQTVLIIDDSILVCEQIKHIMKEENIVIREAHTGKEAEQELEKFQPDVILLDVELPDTKGYELCEKIKNKYKSSASVIFITAKSGDTDVDLGFSLGASDYIRKPFRPAEMKSRIMVQLQSKLQKDELDKKNRELQNNMEKLNYIAFRDVLTGLYNRRYVKDDLMKDIDMHEPGEVGNFIIMADVDDFKSVNDRYGHEAGDEVLICISGIMEEVCRRHKVIRWGGEEFMMVLFAVTNEEAFEISEQIRTMVEGFSLTHGNQTFSCTLTLGLCRYDESRSLDNNIECADKALYAGKRSGKNRSVWYTQDSEAGMKDELL